MLPQHLRNAIHHYIPQMQGWTPPARCCEMAELIIQTRPKTVVEIGVFGGVSLIAQAFALRENQRGIICGIDAYKFDAMAEGESGNRNHDWWRGIDFWSIYQSASKAIWDHRLEDYALLVRARSQDVPWMFPAIDILNIDGCHSETASVRDVENYLPRVVSGGYIWMDDCDWTINGQVSTAKAQEMLSEACELVKAGSDHNQYKLYRKR